VNEGYDFDAIWRNSGPVLWRAVYVYVGGRRDLADDAVAEAFARAMARPNEIRNIVGYLYRLAFQAATVDLRRLDDLREPPEIPTPADEGELEVMQALRQLSPSQRAAIYLHYRADLPVAEVARVGNIDRRRQGSSHAGTPTTRSYLGRGRRCG
jgi:RNA polymerase sigma-70 factor (ECF subfamily)